MHGSKDDVWMDEKSALKLSNLENKDAFIKTWDSGDQTFPILASVKVVRTMDHSSGASQPAYADEKRSARFVIVEAKEQPLDEPQSRRL